MQQRNFFPERFQYNFEQNEKALTKSSISHIGDLRSIECHCRMWSREREYCREPTLLDNEWWYWWWHQEISENSENIFYPKYILIAPGAVTRCETSEEWSWTEDVSTCFTGRRRWSWYRPCVRTPVVGTCSHSPPPFLLSTVPHL